MKKFVVFFALFVWGIQLIAQNSVPFQWTEVFLTAVRNDFARPPMTARSLHHFSMAMYDAWAAYDDDAATVFLGRRTMVFTAPTQEFINLTIDYQRRMRLSVMPHTELFAIAI